MTGTVLILGANGKIGSHAADAFWNAGWTVRRYTRGTDMTKAAEGCDLIVNGLNPPNYHNWAEAIPRITHDVLCAARASGATVIVPGNVYVFGDTPGTWDETTPHRPVTRKGRIRAEMERAYAASGVRTIILRAGDFIDPERNGCMMTLGYLRQIGKGRITAMGDPEALHAFCYLPDWARAAVLLADMRAELAPFEDIPFPGHTFTTRQLHDHLAARLGRDLRLVRFPWWLMTLAAPVWELARELREMHYLFTVPHCLGADKFDRLLPGFVHAPLAEAMEAALPPDVHPDKPVGAGRTARLAVHEV